MVSIEAKNLQAKVEQDALETISNQMHLLFGVLDNAKGI
jgi:hypothetical protein